MPNLSLVVPEVQQSVVRPIVLDIVRQIEEITKIPKDTTILFPGELNKTYQPGSAISETNTDRTQFLNNDIVQIEIDEDFHKESLSSTATTTPEQLPVFYDNKIGIFIKPVYVTTDVSINFKFRSKSKTNIQRWRNDIRMRVSMARDINLHQITYHYLVPFEFISILREIHKLRETIAPYNEDFGNYLVNNSSTRLTELSNQAGSMTELGISETQMRIVGYFDFEGYPDKPEQDEENDTWVGTFTYKFTYEKPIACNMLYPVMIHNQILSTKYRPEKSDAYDLDNHLPSYSLSTNAFNYFESQLQIEKYVNNKASINIPSFDEFIPDDIIRGTINVFTALCQLEINDKKTLINLKELGDINLDEDILDFIAKSEWPYIGKLYQSILQVSIYKSLICGSQELTQVKPSLDVCSVEDLDIRINHRVRFSIVTDLTLLNPEALNRLKRFPKALVKIIQAINEGLRNNPGFNDLGNKKYISKDDIYKYILKPDIRVNRVNLNYEHILRFNRKCNKKYLLTFIIKIKEKLIEIKDTVDSNNLFSLKSSVHGLETDNNLIYNTLLDNNYTDLLFKILNLQSKASEFIVLINTSIAFYSVSNNALSLKGIILDLLNVLHLEKECDDNSASDNTIEVNTVMTTHVIARDGIRTANIDEYQKQFSNIQ